MALLPVPVSDKMITLINEKPGRSATYPRHGNETMEVPMQADPTPLPPRRGTRGPLPISLEQRLASRSRLLENGCDLRVREFPA